jgi:hypothetical protein
LLFEFENLHPIPRNCKDYKKGRSSHFKFDNESEYKITDWMEKNLALSFYEYPKTKNEIEELESEIIKKLVPILNISKNPKNPYKNILLNLRKTCANKASTASNNSHLSAIQIKDTKNRRVNSNRKTVGKYVEFWTKFSELKFQSGLAA